MIIRNTRWGILFLVMTFSLLGLSGWFADSVHAIEVEIELTIRDSRYVLTEWVPPQEGASIVLTIKNEDRAPRHCSRTFWSEQTQGAFRYMGKASRDGILLQGKPCSYVFSWIGLGTIPSIVTCIPHMQGELLLLHVDAV